MIDDVSERNIVCKKLRNLNTIQNKIPTYLPIICFLVIATKYLYNIDNRVSIERQKFFEIPNFFLSCKQEISEQINSKLCILF